MMATTTGHASCVLVAWVPNKIKYVPDPLKLKSILWSLTLLFLWISSRLIRTRRETPSMAFSVALCVTLILLNL